LGTTTSGSAPHEVAGLALPRVHLDEVLRAGFHWSGLPRTGPEPPWAGPGTPHVEAGPPGGLSLRASQGARTSLPAREGVRSRHVPLSAWPPDPRGPAPPRVPVGATADLRVRCRHVSHRRKPSAGSQPACRIKCGRRRRALSEQGMGRPLTGWTGTNDNTISPPDTEAARQLPRQALKTQRCAHGRQVMMTSYSLEQQCMLLQWTESVVRHFIMTSTCGCRG